MEDGVTCYRTTDLDLFSVGDLTALAAALEAGGLSAVRRAKPMDPSEYWRIEEPHWLWTFKAESEVSFRDPETEISAILMAVESLAPPERAAWMSCTHRTFDVAYDCGIKPNWVKQDFTPRTFARLAAAEGLMRLTLYSFDPNAT